MKSLAAILVELNAPLVIEEVEVPPLRHGQVLVQVRRSGICGSQLGEIRGVKGPDKYLPHLLGHEGSGVVLEVGEGVRHVAPGDHVVMHWRPGAGQQADAPRYSSKSRGTVNAGWVTTFNHYSVVSENRVTAIPKEFSKDLSVFFGCAVTTGFGVVTNNAKLRIGESVVVWGAGGVGLNIIQAAAMCSAYPIVAIDLFDNRLALAQQLGATHLCNGKDLPEIEERILAMLGGPADVTIDNTGDPRVIERCYRLAGPQGRVVLVGVPPAGANTSLFTLPLHFGKSITGSHGGESQPHVDIPRFVKLVDAGKLRLEPLIGAKFSLEHINDAIAAMVTGKTSGRCLIEIS